MLQLEGSQPDIESNAKCPPKPPTRKASLREKKKGGQPTSKAISVATTTRAPELAEASCSSSNCNISNYPTNDAKDSHDTKIDTRVVFPPKFQDRVDVLRDNGRFSSGSVIKVCLDGFTIRFDDTGDEVFYYVNDKCSEQALLMGETNRRLKMKAEKLEERKAALDQRAKQVEDDRRSNQEKADRLEIRPAFEASRLTERRRSTSIAIENGWSDDDNPKNMASDPSKCHKQGKRAPGLYCASVL